MKAGASRLRKDGPPFRPSLGEDAGGVLYAIWRDASVYDPEKLRNPSVAARAA